MMLTRRTTKGKSVFIPTTFPNEQSATQRIGMELMFKSAFSDSGSFFALMSICAAHRAILFGRHSRFCDSLDRTLHDPDYYVMKDKCIREMEAKVRNPDLAVSNEAFDTIIGLLTSAVRITSSILCWSHPNPSQLIVGLFAEVRMHLTGLRNMVAMRGGITAGSIRGSSILAAILG